MMNRKGCGRKRSYQIQVRLLSWNFPGGIEANYENLSQVRDMNRVPPEHEARMLTAWLRRSVIFILRHSAHAWHVRSIKHHAVSVKIKTHNA
jgi:hypothetical protein